MYWKCLGHNLSIVILLALTRGDDKTPTGDSNKTRRSDVHSLINLYYDCTQTMASSPPRPRRTSPKLPKNLLIISLKLYFTPARTLAYLRSILDPKNDILVRPQNRSRVLLALIPEFLTVYPCVEIVKSHHFPQACGGGGYPPFLIGAQDCFWEDSGAFTGEVSPLALEQVGVSIVELGHAERRSIFGETNDQTAMKAAAVCAHGMIPLVCVGEVTAPGPVTSEAVRLAVNECAVQVRAVLDAIPATTTVIFAYEPVWAIGKPVPASVGHVAAVADGIRAAIGKREGDARVLYGGSAGPGLWSEGGLGKAVDGMFLGRFAHELDGLRKVVREVEESS